MINQLAKELFNKLSDMNVGLDNLDDDARNAVLHEMKSVLIDAWEFGAIQKYAELQHRLI